MGYGRGDRSVQNDVLGSVIFDIGNEGKIRLGEPY
jgi:hypothetical protein